jgi:uncharacterized cupin superfamily protein
MPGWFVVNIGEAPATRRDRSGVAVRFEDDEDPFPEFGINVRVLQPGQPAGLYHSETVQEAFLVLSGEVLAIVQGEEHTLRAWDFAYCPPGTEHVFVGAGDGPAAILMVGARGPDKRLHYPVSEAAARFGASVEEATSEPREAYASWGPRQPAELDWPPASP